MRLTLGIAKEKLAQHSPAEVLEDRINRSIERILVDGKFNGSMDRIMLQVLYGDLTLPRMYRTLEGVKLDQFSDGNYRVRALTNGWYEFLEGKVTIQDLDRNGFGMDSVESRGDGWATMHDLLPNGQLQLNFIGFAPPSPPPVVTIYGRDSNFMPRNLTLNNFTTVVDNPFSRIERVHAGITPYVVLLQQISDGTTNSFFPSYTPLPTGTIVNQAIIEPLEQETFYRRYHDNTLTSQPVVNAICYVKKRHIEYESDEDILEITNLTALGFEMDSLQYMAENDVSLANQYHDEAIRVLNEELRDVHAVDEVPTLRFRHPGGAPSLTSHY